MPKIVTDLSYKITILNGKIKIIYDQKYAITIELKSKNEKLRIMASLWRKVFEGVFMHVYLKILFFTLALMSSFKLAFSKDKCDGLFLSTPKAELSLWSNSTSLTFSLEANFALLRKKADGGNWYGEDWDAPAAGMMGEGFLTIMTEDQKTIRVPIDIRARGMSSLNEPEYEFPKLKVKIGKKERSQLRRTEFDFIKSFRINTHVANKENINDPKMARTMRGRLISENSPLREQLAYEIARVLGLLTPHTRLATINYVDASQKASVTKRALLIETDGSLQSRIKGELITDLEVSQFKIIPVDQVEGALFHLFHKIIGNEDVGLHIYEDSKMPTEKNRPLFNTHIYQLPDGSYRPLIYDMDLSSFVSGYELRESSFYKNDFFNLTDGNKAITANMLYKLRMRIPHRHILAAIERTKKVKVALYQSIEDAYAHQNLDHLGYQNAKAHLDSYFAVVDSVMATPVLGTKNVQFYHDSKGKQSGLILDPATGESSTLRIGTPIKILGEENNMYRVSIIDTTWDVNYRSSTQKGVPSSIGYVSKEIKFIDFLTDGDVGLLDARDMSY